MQSPTIKDYLKYVEQLDQIYGSKNVEMDEKIEKKSENIEMIEMEEEIFSHKKDELKKIGELKKTEQLKNQEISKKTDEVDKKGREKFNFFHFFIFLLIFNFNFRFSSLLVGFYCIKFREIHFFYFIVYL